LILDEFIQCKNILPTNFFNHFANKRLLIIKNNIAIENFCYLSIINIKQIKVNKISIALHGGAGNIYKTNFSKELESAYNRSMDIALQIGVKILAKGGSSLDAVEATIVELENCPLFNAGKGSVYNAIG